MAVDIGDMREYQKELRNDFIINKELSNLGGNLALKCGRGLALANAVLMTAKHIDLNARSAPSDLTHTSSALPLRPRNRDGNPSRDPEGYLLEFQDEVPELTNPHQSSPIVEQW